MAAFPLRQDISEFLYIRPLCKRGELFYHIIFKDIYIFQSNISLQRYFIDIIEALYKCIYHLIHNAHHIQTFPRMHMNTCMHIHACSPEQKKGACILA